MKLNAFWKGVLQTIGFRVETIDPALGPAYDLVDLQKKLAPDLEEAEKHIDALLPLIDEGLPHALALYALFQKTWPDIKKAKADLAAVAPLAQAVKDYLGEDQPQAKAQHVVNALAQYHGGPRG